MGKENLVIIVLKSMSKGESIVSPEEPTLVPFVLILIIINTLTYSVPSYSLLFFNFIREAQYFHAIVVKGVRFSEVEEIESDFLIFVGI